MNRRGKMQKMNLAMWCSMDYLAKKMKLSCSGLACQIYSLSNPFVRVQILGLAHNKNNATKP